MTTRPTPRQIHEQAFARGRRDAKRGVSRGACPYGDAAKALAWELGYDFEKKLGRKV